jgi:hypothetical protein
MLIFPKLTGPMFLREAGNKTGRFIGSCSNISMAPFSNYVLPEGNVSVIGIVGDGEESCPRYTVMIYQVIF